MTPEVCIHQSRYILTRELTASGVERARILVIASNFPTRGQWASEYQSEKRALCTCNMRGAHVKPCTDSLFQYRDFHFCGRILSFRTSTANPTLGMDYLSSFLNRTNTHDLKSLHAATIKSVSWRRMSFNFRGLQTFQGCNQTLFVFTVTPFLNYLTRSS